MPECESAQNLSFAPALFSIASGIFWIVVMAGCWEWPYYDTYSEAGGRDADIGVHMWFRRYQQQFGMVSSLSWSTPCIPSCTTKNRWYADVTELPRIASCANAATSEPRRQSYQRYHDAAERNRKLRWICGDAAAVSVLLRGVAVAQIVALAACPLLALMFVVCPVAVYLKQRQGAVVALVFTSVLGAAIAVTLWVTVGMLADFNANGLPGVAPPQDSGWVTTSGPMAAFAVVIALQTAAHAILVAYYCHRTGASFDEEASTMCDEGGSSPPGDGQQLPTGTRVAGNDQDHGLDDGVDAIDDPLPTCVAPRSSIESDRHL